MEGRRAMADELVGKPVLVTGDNGPWEGTVTARAADTGNWYGQYEVAAVDGDVATVHAGRMQLLDSGSTAPGAPSRVAAVSAVTAVIYGTEGWSRTGARVVAALADEHDWLPLAAIPVQEVQEAADDARA